ncbi:hypothetical protein BDV10DRAFT_94463 [Aspergillus recurvatus]
MKSSWTVAVLPPVVIHADAKAAAGVELFDILADTRVQIVDADDKARIHKFTALGDPKAARNSDRRASIGGGLELKDLGKARERPKNAVSAIFGPEVWGYQAGISSRNLG